MTMPTEDRLLTIDEAAEILHLSKDWLYRHWEAYPFAFKWSPRKLRFSANGLQRYIGEMQHAKSTRNGQNLPAR